MKILVVTLVCISCALAGDRFLQEAEEVTEEEAVPEVMEEIVLPELGAAAFPTLSCSQCLNYYSDTYYCSSVDSKQLPASLQTGYCCGNFTDAPNLKPRECFSIPRSDYWCSNVYMYEQDQIGDDEPEVDEHFE